MGRPGGLSPTLCGGTTPAGRGDPSDFGPGILAQGLDRSVCFVMSIWIVEVSHIYPRLRAWVGAAARVCNVTDRLSFVASGQTVRGVLESWWGRDAVDAIPGIELFDRPGHERSLPYPNSLRAIRQSACRLC